MNNSLLQIKIKQRLNKLASYDYDNLQCWQIQEAFNKGQLQWVRRQVYGLNSRKQGQEQSTGLVDDLRIIMTDAPLTGTNLKEFYQAALPPDYLYYVRVDAYAASDCCPPRRMTIYEAEESNIGVILVTDALNPSFEWAETISTIVGNNIRIYTSGKFKITDSSLTYYRRPKDIQIVDCVDSYGQIITKEQICEFNDDVVELIIDEAASILAGDIESINQLQRASQNVQSNT